jgi:hypothetical protein
MVTIKFQDENELRELSSTQLQEKILSICERHQDEDRAMAFAFILFDFDNPQISSVLSDFKYWKALDKISGQYLSVFHLHTTDKFFADDLRRFDGIVFKELHNTGISSSDLAKLKFFIEPSEDIKLPSILFFQTNGKTVIDYFMVELKEETIEKSFLEIKDYIKAAVDSLSRVTDANRENRQPIFDLIESNVKAAQMKKNFNRKIKSFPLNMIIGWLVGKI